MTAHPLAGRPAPRSILVDVPRLVTAYYAGDASAPVAFGTSGHRGSALDGAFNDAHVAAIAQAIVEVRAKAGVTGPLFLGKDTHALSTPAHETALEVFAANGVEVLVTEGYVPTPVLSFAILAHNADPTRARADGVGLTPSHNPPEDGGLKYNPPSGGPADTDLTGAIERRANELLRAPSAIRRSPRARGRPFDYLTPYVRALGEVVELDAAKGVKIGVDPLGGAGIAYWGPIADEYGLDIEVTNPFVDPTFGFMCVDRDGKIRMDCSSPWAMAGLVALKDRFDLAFGNDCDYDRHGVVTPKGGLMSPNHYLSVAIDHLYRSRAGWGAGLGIGKTLVSSALIDRVAARLGRRLVEVPVGFKWFVEGLASGTLGFGGEESAGAAFLRRDGRTWVTEKDGFIMDLLAVEILSKTGRDPYSHYLELTAALGAPVYERIDAKATPAEKARLKKLAPGDVRARTLAGEPITAVLSHAPGNGAPIGGLKVCAESGWFAARPSGTEDVYKIYAESFRGAEHLARIQEEAKAMVGAALAG